jgi:hypothetical protein
VIRYTIPAPALADRVDAAFPKWRTKAAKRTARFKKGRRFAEKSSIWSDVKPLYMTLQGENKCIYCERKFGSVEASTVEHDLEHFRPKSHVDGWTPPLSLQQAGVTVTHPQRTIPATTSCRSTWRTTHRPAKPVILAISSIGFRSPVRTP